MFAAAFLVVSCSNRPDGVLDKEAMARLLVDIHKGESVVEVNPRMFPTDSAKRAFKQSIYAKHGVSSADADSSFAWYGYHMEKYMEVYERVEELLGDELARANEIAGASDGGMLEMNIALDGDSVDVWPGIKYRRLSRTMPSDFITFNLSTDRYWEHGDVYSLRFKTLDTRGDMQVDVSVNYSDGTHEYLSRRLIGEGWHDVKFALDSARSATKISGAMYYRPQPGEVAYVDSLSLIRTRWVPHQRPARAIMQPLGRKKRGPASGTFRDDR